MVGLFGHGSYRGHVDHRLVIGARWLTRKYIADGTEAGRGHLAEISVTFPRYVTGGLQNSGVTRDASRVTRFERHISREVKYIFDPTFT